jgi:hypothetical protein
VSGGEGRGFKRGRGTRREGALEHELQGRGVGVRGGVHARQAALAGLHWHLGGGLVQGNRLPVDGNLRCGRE